MFHFCLTNYMMRGIFSVPLWSISYPILSCKQVYLSMNFPQSINKVFHLFILFYNNHIVLFQLHRITIIIHYNKLNMVKVRPNSSYNRSWDQVSINQPQIHFKSSSVNSHLRSNLRSCLKFWCGKGSHATNIMPNTYVKQFSVLKWSDCHFRDLPLSQVRSVYIELCWMRLVLS